MRQLPFREIHLDFHTSPLIEDVGSEFDADKFAEMLQSAYVNSVTCFAKCHHGMSYYPTKVGVMHPHLKFDLLGEMLAACHERGIRVPVYYSVCFDNYVAESHPEWVQCDQEGHLFRPSPYEAGWHTLCLNTPYVDSVGAQMEEILNRYEVDGVFFDIVWQPRPGCLCASCRKSMDAMRLDIASNQDLVKHSLVVETRFLKAMQGLVERIRPGASVFFNAPTNLNFRPRARFFTHYEIESLPTAFWGYHHFPFAVRFYRGFYKEVLGMTARFHKSWADFGGIKTKSQLDYECASMLANGAKCSVGDQLHPRGVLEKAAYDLVGRVYRGVAEKEPWCEGAEPLTQIAILLLRDEQGGLQREDSSEGAMKMLLELKHQFDVIDPESDFGKYDLLVLPDSGQIDDETAIALGEYLDEGGRLLVSHEATLDPKSKRFRCPEIGVEYVGLSEYCPDFIHLGDQIFGEIPKLDVVMYERGSYVKPIGEARTLAAIYNPYFNRTFRAFTSHFQTPVDRPSGHPAITLNGNVAYVYAPIFRAYYEHGYFVYKEIVCKCIQVLLPRRLVKSSAPASSEVSLTRQSSRLIAHIVNYSPQRRGKGVEYIEDAYPLRNISLSVLTETRPNKVYLAPAREELSFDYLDGYASCIVPETLMHQMVVFELGR